MVRILYGRKLASHISFPHRMWECNFLLYTSVDLDIINIMQVIRSKDLKYIPASHEDQSNPGVWKKILFKKADLVKGRIQMINWAKLPVGSTFRAHFHEDMVEVFIILNGKTSVRIDDEVENLEKGDAVVTPVKHVHQMTNICSEDVLYIVIGISRGLDGKTVVV